MGSSEGKLADSPYTMQSHACGKTPHFCAQYPNNLQCPNGSHGANKCHAHEGPKQQSNNVHAPHTQMWGLATWPGLGWPAPTRPLSEPFRCRWERQQGNRPKGHPMAALWSLRDTTGRHAHQGLESARQTPTSPSTARVLGRPRTPQVF